MRLLWMKCLWFMGHREAGVSVMKKSLDEELMKVLNFDSFPVENKKSLHTFLYLIH